MINQQPDIGSKRSRWAAAIILCLVLILAMISAAIAQNRGGGGSSGGGGLGGPGFVVQIPLNTPRGRNNPPPASSVSAKVFARHGGSSWTTGHSYDVLRGLNWAIVDKKARIVNFSFAEPRDPLLQAATVAAAEKGAIMAAAHVSGTIALMVQVSPGLSLENAVSRLSETATDLGASGPDPRRLP